MLVAVPGQVNLVVLILVTQSIFERTFNVSLTQSVFVSVYLCLQRLINNLVICSILLLKRRRGLKKIAA